MYFGRMVPSDSAPKLQAPISTSNGAYHSENPIHEYFQIIVRGRWIILVVFTLVMAATMIYVLRNKPRLVYSTTATIALKNKSGNLNPYPVYRDPAKINNELVILKSRRLAETIADSLLKRVYIDPETKNEKLHIIHRRVESNGHVDYEPLNKRSVVRRLQSSASFSPIPQSDIIQISVKSTHPEEAKLIANLFAETYYQWNVERSRTELIGTRKFLEKQLEQKRERLYQAEDSLRKYMEASNVMTDDAGATATIEKIAQLEATRSALEIDIQAFAEKIKSYEDKLGSKSNVNVIAEQNDPYITQLQEQIANLEVQRDVTITQNPALAGQEAYIEKMAEINAQIEALRSKLQQRTEEYRKSILKDENLTASDILELRTSIFAAQMEMQTLKTKKEILDSTIADYERKIKTLPQKSIDYARLVRQRSSAEKLYLLVEQHYNEASIAEQSEFGNVEIIESAETPTKPINPPKPLRTVFLGGFLGLGLGLGIVFVREFFNTQIRTPEDIKKRGYTLLSVIPSMSLDNANRKKRKSKSVAENPQLLTFANPRSTVAESYRQLRTYVQFSKTDTPVKTIMVSSANPSEGKTTTASNMAVAFATMGKKVLLIDCDMRKPQLHNRFSLDREPGLSNIFFYTAAVEKICHKTSVDNLDVICSGIIPPNPAEILSSTRMIEFVKEMRDQYDLIIFDTPPILRVADPSIVSTLVDGVILVVASGKTPAGGLNFAVETLVKVKANLLGIVLNDFDPKKAYGGYYYGNYYKYYYYSSYYGSDRDKKKQRSIKLKS
ncbi:MAG: polysaccharide biosynthesis tyrosine autokinase [Gemmatimonadetes bacterium]|nr:MAG: polysaccharide biosynthesis tyrosine autokinase [Gemmatimonadota bacterium]